MKADRLDAVANEAGGDWAVARRGNRLLECRLRIMVDPRTGGLVRKYEYRLNGRRITRERALQTY